MIENDEPVSLTSRREDIDNIIEQYEAAKIAAKTYSKQERDLKAAILQAMGSDALGLADKHGVRVSEAEVAETTSTRKAHKRVTLKTFDRQQSVDALDPNWQAPV